MIQIVKTKELRSTTKVEGVMVLMSDGQWYGVSRMQPLRSNWVIRGSNATRTGRLSMEDIFLKRCGSKPDIQEGVDMLVRVLNGEEPIKDNIVYY
jgi:hypothetical protein